MVRLGALLRAARLGVRTHAVQREYRSRRHSVRH
jgi:hypothetical protein